MAEKLRAGDIWLVTWPYRDGADEDGRTVKDRPAIVVRHWLYGPRLTPLTSQEKRRDQEGSSLSFSQTITRSRTCGTCEHQGRMRSQFIGLIFDFSNPLLES